MEVDAGVTESARMLCYLGLMLLALIQVRIPTKMNPEKWFVEADASLTKRTRVATNGAVMPMLLIPMRTQQRKRTGWLAFADASLTWMAQVATVEGVMLEGWIERMYWRTMMM